MTNRRHDVGDERGTPPSVSDQSQPTVIKDGGASPAPAGWRSIESAPIGEPLLVTYGYLLPCLAYRVDRLHWDDLEHNRIEWPTHWMPLPEPPK